MKFKNKLKIFLPVFLIMISMTVFTIPACAMGEAFFTLPGNGAVNKGENFSVTLNFSATENIGKVNAKIAYDSNAMEFTGGADATGGDGIIFIKSNGNGSTDTSYTLNFKGTGASQSAQINIITSNLTAQDGSSIGSPMAYCNVTVVDNGNSPDESEKEESRTSVTTPPEDSQETNTTSQELTTVIGSRLSSLTVDTGELEPEFSPDIFDYTVNVGYDVTNVEIQANSENINDYIWYSGTSECQVGENIRTITVNDQYGNQTVYTVKVIRADENSITTTTEPEKTMHIPQTKTHQEQSAFERDKSMLNSVMIIILIVLVIALVVIIFWIRTKIMGKNNKSKKK